MTKKRPPLADIIAKTPGANVRADAEAFLNHRRTELLGAPANVPQPPEPDAAPEPAPIIENPDRYAEDFWQRFVDKQNAGKKPPKKPAQKSSRKKPGRPTKRPSPFTVIDGEGDDTDKK